MARLRELLLATALVAALALCAAAAKPAGRAAARRRADPGHGEEEPPPTFDVLGTVFVGPGCHDPATQVDVFWYENVPNPINHPVNTTEYDLVITCDESNPSNVHIVFISDAGEANLTATTSLDCAQDDAGTVSINIACTYHQPQVIVSAPATWTGTFNQTVPESMEADPEQCRFQGIVTLSQEKVNDTAVVAVVKGEPQKGSVCGNETEIVLQSPPMADLSQLYRFRAAFNGYVFTVNRVQHEGALEIFYNVPYVSPNVRYTCIEGDCQPVYSDGTVVVITTFFLVFALPFIVICGLGITHRKSRVHDD